MEEGTIKWRWKMTEYPRSILFSSGMVWFDREAKGKSDDKTLSEAEWRT